MRQFLLTATMLAATSPAFASSIEVVGSAPAKSNSIMQVTCTDCPALVTRESKHAYKVPAVPSGEQTAEIVDVDGQKKLKRVESWLGGSPVTIISSADGWSTKGSMVIAGAEPATDAIDHDATTAAVNVAPPTDGKRNFDAASFELRLK